MDYYILSEDKQSYSLAPKDIIRPEVIITDPSRETNAEYGRYPYIKVEEPSPDEGKIVKQDGYDVFPTEEGPVISENWKQLTVVDPYEVIPEGKILLNSEWVIEGDNYVHKGLLLTIVDPYETIPEGKILLHDEWVIEGENYVHTGVLKNLIDNPPEVGPNQRLDDLGWEETEEDYIHKYHLVTVIDEPPTEPAAEGYHWEKVGEEWVDEDTVRYIYEQVQDPPPPSLTISKMYFEIEMAKRGLLEALDTLIDNLQVPLDDQGHTIPARRLYDRAVEFKTDNIYFMQFFKQGCAALGLTEEEGWEILYASQPKDLV